MSQSSTLTITELREYLTAEHAARVLTGEIWWSVVPGGDNNPKSFASTGDASAFWALVDAVGSMGQPLGYIKEKDFLGRDTNKPHSDPELLLRQIIKPNVMMDKPNKDIITARAILAGQDPEKLYQLRELEYKTKIEADQARIDQVIRTILAQHHDIVDPNAPFDDLDDESGRSVTGGEWEMPIDRVIEFGERQLKFLASNPKVQDNLFEAERLLWQDEIDKLSHIIQKRENEGAGEGSRHIDEQLLSGAGMSAGMNAGKQ